MKVNSRSYPHPVLGNEDDLGGFFNAEFRYELGKDEIVLSPVFSLQNSGVSELIKKGKAAYVTEVECGATFFRKSFASDKPIERLSISSSLLREKVTVGFYVCAKQDISNYKPTEPNSDYEGAVFDIEAGDVLALGGYCSFNADKDFDPLRPPVASFMSIMEGRHHEGPIDIDYETDKITIILSKTDWRNYLAIRNQKAAEPIIHSSIVLPVLIDAIHQMQSNGANLESMNWYGRLEAILEAKGLRDKDPFQAAQKILDNPVARGFASASSLLEDSDEQEYE